MDPKAKTQLVERVKWIIGMIDLQYFEEGVLVLRDVANEWLVARSKKAKSTRSRAQRKKS